ncbi:hypothetical protein H0H93_001874 [Arthromyces matolae]|nr:hypothetical protein H0H93_001874 [Arthromyces matolae]
MPVQGDSSFVPDSTYSPSPPTTPAVVKRAQRTYGRIRNIEAANAGDDSDASLMRSTRSSSSALSVQRTGRSGVEEEIPPSSDPVHDNSMSVDDDDTQGDGETPFRFPWQIRMEKMNMESVVDTDVDDTVTEESALTRVAGKGLVSPLSSHSPVANDTTNLDPEGPVLTQIATSPAVSRAVTPSDSPQVVNRRRNNARTAVIHDSDSEDGGDKESSPTSPSHTLTTPKLISSPTPPTSEDDMPTRIGRDVKGKGKAPSRPDVIPLLFSKNPAASIPLKSQTTKEPARKHKKTKAPTKKEMQETARSRGRIAADQPVSIPRIETSISKYSLPNLLINLAPKHPESEDPITEFQSEPTSSPAIPHVARRAPILRQSDGSPLKRKSPLKAMRSLPELSSDSDEELPAVEVLLKKEQEAFEAHKRQNELLERKKRAIALNTAVISSRSDDDDDDLQVVQTVDMQTAIKEEEAERRSGRKKRPSEGRKRQLHLGGIGLAKQKERENQSKIDGGMDLLRRIGANRSKKGDPTLTQASLLQLIRSEAEAQRQVVVEQKEREWVEGGGTLKNLGSGDNVSVQEANKLYAEKGRELLEGRTIDEEVENEEDASDEDWTPEPSIQLRGSASPSDYGSGNKRDASEVYEENDARMVNDGATSVTEEEEEGYSIPLRPRTMATVVLSDDEDATSPIHGKKIGTRSRLSHRNSISSLDDRTEDEDNKENETSRIWDRGEDKENKAVVRHIPCEETSPATTKSGLSSLEGRLTGQLSMPPGYLDPVQDPFASPSFEARLKLSSPACLPSTSVTPLIAFKGGKALEFSPSFDGDANIGPAPLQPSFSDLFESGTEKQTTAHTPFKQNRSALQESFQDQALPRNKLDRASTLDLTQDISLQPAFEVSATFLRKADEIFEKEQEFVLEAASKRPQEDPELYVNDHGQLDFALPSPRGRLHKRGKTPDEGAYRSSQTPSPIANRPLNAFDLLKRGSAKHNQLERRPLEKSEFVEQEAQESDDEEMFGFGPSTKKNDDEEDGEDLDRNLEALVDDAEMDVETQAADLVMEKFQEHEQVDDEALQKLHEMATKGELRKKRKNGVLGLDDSDDDSDDDGDERLRKRLHKKQKIERQSIKELGQHDETKAFSDTYLQAMQPETGQFDYLEESQPLDMMVEKQNDEDVPQETISVTEVNKRIREAAQKPRDEEDVFLNPNDVSFTDDVPSDSENYLPVKPVHIRPRNQAQTRRNAQDPDFDTGFESISMTSVQTGIPSDRSRKWASDEGRSRHIGVTGRNAGGAAVTGHKVKSGGGSLRKSAAGGSKTSSSAPNHPETRRLLKADASIVHRVNKESAARFG